jgi:hypothetical protein
MNHGEFILASKNRIQLPEYTFQGGPWTHLATATRGFKEYVALLHEPSQEIYLEEISALGQFQKIENETEWQELLQFFFSKGIVGFVKDREVVTGKWEG